MRTIHKNISDNETSSVRSDYWKLKLKLVIVVAALLGSTFVSAQVLPAVGTTAILGKVDGVAIEAKVQSPSTQLTPLQIVCVFEYVEGDITNPPALPPAANGLLHVDEALKGLITELRKSGKFAGHLLETLLITPPKGSIPAQRLLLIGLGNRNQFDAEIMTKIGQVGMREALRLGVTSYSHASNLKDAGIDSPTGEVAINVVKGATEAYETELFLKKKGLTWFKPLTKMTLLSGQAFFVPSGDAIKSYIQTHKN